MKKIDGHTHTHYCPHGNGDHVEKMIQRAIALGFDEYHITEHPPLPSDFVKNLLPLEVIPILAMTEDQVEPYIKEMLSLKEKYKQDITIKIGFEIDFLPEHTGWTKDFLQEYGEYCDTGLVSVHFMQGTDGWRCVDYKAEDTKVGLVDYYGDNQAFQLAYYDLVQQSILTDLGPYKPTRIGHMTLCNKFKKHLYLKEEAIVTKKIDETLQMVRNYGYSLDYNVAGLFKPYCGETYPTTHIVQQAKQLNIPLIYGSDSHKIADVGREYKVYEENMLTW